MVNESKLGKTMTRCDQCPDWVFEYAGPRAIAEGHCPVYSTRDSCDKPCANGIESYRLSLMKNKTL